MPLLHQDNNRGGGGSRENRRSLADILGADTLQLAEAATQTTNREGGNEWRWEKPSSPEAAQTVACLGYGDGIHPSGWGDEEKKRQNTSLEPLKGELCPPGGSKASALEPLSPAAAQSPCTLVPSTCFPPRQTTAFASYSESASPGGWGVDQTDHGITDLVTSLNTLSMPPPKANGSKSFNLKRLSCDALETVEYPWPPEGAHPQPQQESNVARRASFCGVVSKTPEGNIRWRGVLPARGEGTDAGYSPKLFLGGLPYELTEQTLMQALKPFQPVRVEWPGRGVGALKGCAYVTLDSELRVRAMLAACKREGSKWFYKFPTKNMRTKEVQVIPWVLSDSNWVAADSLRLEPKKTVFVGALHGMLSAAALATIMNDLFSGVIYVALDIDKSKYPIGSGRVAFNNVHSYVRAISAAYVEICTDKFIKKVQVDPYLEDSMCSLCNLQQGPYFCRDPLCFRYFCRSCWGVSHAVSPRFIHHKALMRNCRNAVFPPAVSPAVSRLLALPPSSGPHGNNNRPQDGGYNGFENASHDGAAPSPSNSGSGSL